MPNYTVKAVRKEAAYKEQRIYRILDCPNENAAIDQCKCYIELEVGEAYYPIKDYFSWTATEDTQEKPGKEKPKKWFLKRHFWSEEKAVDFLNKHGLESSDFKISHSGMSISIFYKSNKELE